MDNLFTCQMINKQKINAQRCSAFAGKVHWESICTSEVPLSIYLADTEKVLSFSPSKCHTYMTETENKTRISLIPINTHSGVTPSKVAEKLKCMQKLGV